MFIKPDPIFSLSEIPEYKASTELAGVSSSTITVKLDKTDHQANYSCLVYNEVNVNNKLLDYVVLNVKCKLEQIEPKHILALLVQFYFILC